jgi:hypothetical protein
MSRLRLPVCLLALVFLPRFSSGAPQQRDAPPSSPLPAATGRIAGAVVAADTGRPVRFARVRLERPGGSVEALTDEAGGFSFERLAPGSYRLHVSKPGYLTTEWGQARPGTETSGKPMVLRDREQLDRLVISLSHGGSISGIVRDDRGEPAYGARVRAFRWVTRNGVRALDEVASVEADERGAYRISRLPPRQYVVSAAPSGDEIPQSKDAPSPVGFAPVFHPSATTAENAAPIPLALGEDRTNVEFQLPLVRLGRVTGRVLDADGRPVANESVSLVDAAGSGTYHEQGTTTGADGRFTFDRVVPGAYVVKAGEGESTDRIFTYSGKVEYYDRSVAVSFEKVLMREVDDKPRWITGSIDVMPSPSKHDAPSRGTAATEVTAASGAVSDVVLTLEPPRNVAGRVVFDGASPRPPVKEWKVTLRLVSGESTTANVNDDGTFVVPRLAPGRYIVSADRPGSEWNLTSATSAGVEALDFLLEVPGDRDVRDLLLTFTDRGSELSGSVTDAAGRPRSDGSVIVFATDERFWGAGDRRIRMEQLSADGRYSFAHLPPGAYRLAVVDGVEPDEWLDPSFLRQLAGASIPVTIGEGERKRQDLRAGGR